MKCKMSDLAFLPSSPWMSDYLPPKEVLLSSEYGFPFDLEESEIIQEATTESQLWACFQPADVSVANSECSDGVSVDIDGDLEESVLLSGFLTSTAVDRPVPYRKDSPHEIVVNDELSLNITDEEEESLDDCFLLDEEEHNYTVSPHQKQTTSETLNRSIIWSNLSLLEQHKLADDLSSIISKELGLREQLEVIRIINPQADVSPTDTEFTIDLSCLDNEKLQRVQEFVRQHLTSCNPHHTRGRTQPRKESSQRHYSTGSSYSNQADQSPSSDLVIKSSHRKTTKRTVNQHQQQEHRQKQRKRSKQQLKEKKSGLFVQEQILAVTAANQQAENVEVDILS